MDTLAVDVNRDGPHSIDVAPSFHVDGPFEVVVENHGSALHVHLQVDDDLAQAVSLSANNHFVKQGSVRRVTVDVDASKLPVRGHLKVVTGYGSETEFVTVTVDEPTEEETGVDVDESLGQPRPRPEAASAEERPGRLDLDDAPVVALGALAVVVALLAALAVGGDLPLVAVLVVLLGVAVGGVLLTR